MKNKGILSIILAGAIFIAILLLDLLTKGLIIPNVIPNVGDTVDVIPGFVNFVFVKNTGAAWGMLAGRPIFLIVISIVVLGLLLAYYFLRIKKVGENSSLIFGISIGLVAGGCLGNLVDRIVFGYVRDFINFQFMSFPVFNFADIALTVGMVLILVYFVFSYAKEEKTKEKKTQETELQENVSLSNIDQFEAVASNNEKAEDPLSQKSEKEGGRDEG